MEDIDLTLRRVLSRQDYPSPPKGEKLEKMVNEDYEEPGIAYGQYTATAASSIQPIFQVVANNNAMMPNTLNLTGWTNNTTGTITATNFTTATIVTANNNDWSIPLTVNGTLSTQSTTNLYTYNNGWFSEPIVEKDDRIKDLLKFLLVDDEDSIESDLIIRKFTPHEKIEEIKYHLCEQCGALILDNNRFHEICEDCSADKVAEFQDYHDFFREETNDIRTNIPTWDDWQREFRPAA